MTKIQSLKVAVFDVDGTLLSFTTSIGEVYAQVLAAHGVLSDPHLLNRVVKRTWSGFQDRYLNTIEQHVTSHDRERAVWLEFTTTVLEESGISCVGRKHLVEAIYHSFSSPQGRVAEPGAFECLQALRALGVVVVAATNNDIRTKEVLNVVGLTEHLDAVYVAAELSWKKPSPKYFDAIASRLQVPPQSILHIGNHAELDILPARMSGWSGLLYDPHGKGGEPRVGSLAEVVSFFSRR